MFDTRVVVIVCLQQSKTPLIDRFIDRSEFLSSFLAEAVNEILNQQEDVSCTFAQRRHIDREYIQSIKEVFTEFASPTSAFKSR
jgi:hypothetical protein